MIEIVYHYGELAEVMGPQQITRAPDIQTVIDRYQKHSKVGKRFARAIRQGDYIFSPVKLTEESVKKMLEDSAQKKLDTDHAVYETLTTDWKSTELHIYPAAYAEIAPFAAALFAGLSTFGVQFAIGASFAVALKAAAVTAVLTLATGLLFKPRNPDPDGLTARERLRSLYFRRPVTVQAEGEPIPLIFGRARVGAIVTSAGISSAKVASDDRFVLSYSGYNGTQTKANRYNQRITRPSEIPTGDQVVSAQTLRMKLLLGEGPIFGPINKPIGATDNFLSSIYVGSIPDERSLLTTESAVQVPDAQVFFNPGTFEQDPFPDLPTEDEVVVRNFDLTQAESFTTGTIPPGRSVRIRILFPRGLERRSDTSRDTFPEKVEFTFETSLAAGTRKLQIIELKGSVGYSQDFIVEPRDENENLITDQEYTVTVRRTTADTDDILISNETQIGGYTTLLDENTAHHGLATIGIISRSEHLTSPDRDLSFDIGGLLLQIPSNFDPVNRTYNEGTELNPVVWDGRMVTSQDLVNDPSWCLYTYLTNKTWGRGRRFNHDNIDVDELYVASRDENNKILNYTTDLGTTATRAKYEFNHVFTDRAPVNDIIGVMCEAMAAVPGQRNGKFSIAQDRRKEAKYIFTPENMVPGSFERNVIPISNRFTKSIVFWNNEGEEAKEIVYYGSEYDARGGEANEIRTAGITNRGQAFAVGTRSNIEDNEEYEIIKFQTGISTIEIGDVSEIETPLEGRAIAGSVGINRIYGRLGTIERDCLMLDPQALRVRELDNNPVQTDLDETFMQTLIEGISLHTTDALFNVRDKDGLRQSYFLDNCTTPADAPGQIRIALQDREGNPITEDYRNLFERDAVYTLWYRGSLSDEGLDTLHLATPDNTAGTLSTLKYPFWRLIGKEYTEEEQTILEFRRISLSKYDREELGIDPNILPIRSLRGTPIKPPTNLNFTEFLVEQRETLQVNVDLTWTRPDDARVKGYIVRAKSPSGEWETLGTTSNIGFYRLKNVEVGFWEFQVYPRIDPASNELVGTGAYLRKEVKGKEAPPNDVLRLSATRNVTEISLSWARTPDPDFSHYEIRRVRGVPVLRGQDVGVQFMETQWEADTAETIGAGAAVKGTSLTHPVNTTAPFLYMVKAFDKWGNESVNEARVIVPLPRMRAVQPLIEQTGTRVQGSWDPIDIAGVGYEVRVGETWASAETVRQTLSPNFDIVYPVEEATDVIFHVRPYISYGINDIRYGDENPQEITLLPREGQNIVFRVNLLEQMLRIASLENAPGIPSAYHRTDTVYRGSTTPGLLIANPNGGSFAVDMRLAANEIENPPENLTGVFSLDIELQAVRSPTLNTIKDLTLAEVRTQKIKLQTPVSEARQISQFFDQDLLPIQHTPLIEQTDEAVTSGVRVFSDEARQIEVKEGKRTLDRDLTLFVDMLVNNPDPEVRLRLVKFVAFLDAVQFET